MKYLILTFLIVFSSLAIANTTYCNKQSDTTTVCNTYYENGSMTSDYVTTQSDTTTTVNRYVDTRGEN